MSFLWGKGHHTSACKIQVIDAEEGFVSWSNLGSTAKEAEEEVKAYHTFPFDAKHQCCLSTDPHDEVGLPNRNRY
uniref:Uncharacterized protein n=1 Tax=Sphaerodactylus townsendi TaxID=933632 RepID=A0ACB8GES6_9SAUR